MLIGTPALFKVAIRVPTFRTMKSSTKIKITINMKVFPLILIRPLRGVTHPLNLKFGSLQAYGRGISNLWRRKQ